MSRAPLCRCHLRWSAGDWTSASWARAGPGAALTGRAHDSARPVRGVRGAWPGSSGSTCHQEGDDVNVTIAGAHGQIALRLARLLAARGDRVRGLVRNPEHVAEVRGAGAW